MLSRGSRVLLSASKLRGYDRVFCAEPYRNTYNYQIRAHQTPSVEKQAGSAYCRVECAIGAAYIQTFRYSNAHAKETHLRRVYLVEDTVDGSLLELVLVATLHIFTMLSLVSYFFLHSPPP